ncbi:hypothetical protein EVA_20729 [gut metagenome]|uniref:Uncharacterized protein n=1 Tax=gut metagenome TaxID=749906 RepID=J9FNK7_9ZZZZ
MQAFAAPSQHTTYGQFFSHSKANGCVGKSPSAKMIVSGTSAATGKV